MPDEVPPYDPTVTVNWPVLALLLGLIAVLAVSTFFSNRKEWSEGQRFAPLLRTLILAMVLLTLATERGNYVLATASERSSEDMLQLQTSFLQEYRILHLFVISFTFPFLALAQVIANLRSLYGKGSIWFLPAEILALTGLAIGLYSSNGWFNIVSAHVN